LKFGKCTVASIFFYFHFEIHFEIWNDRQSKSSTQPNSSSNNNNNMSAAMGWDDHTTTTNQSTAKGMPPLTMLLAASPWMLPEREIRPSTGNINHNNSDNVASTSIFILKFGKCHIIRKGPK
jgi:hypothetical protein